MTANEGVVTTDDGVRLFFRRAGVGEQVVLIPNGTYLFDDFEHLANERTLVFYDVRNRGRSDHVDDPAKLIRGIHHDAEDVDAVRRYFGVDQVDVLGHSYVGVTVILFAMRYPAHARRVVQIGAMAPNQSRQYPSHLTNLDQTFHDVLAGLAQLEKERPSLDAQEFCRKFWSILLPIYVVDPADAHRLRWSRCELPNERAFMKPWLEHLLPSIQRLNLTAADMAKVTAPVLIVHGTKDRSAPYGGGRDWAASLPHARLVTVDRAAHAPWIEAPDQVFASIATFLDGAWPEGAEKIISL